MQPRVRGNRDARATNQGSVYRNSKHRVGAGKVPMSVIDGAQLVFGPGLFGVVCRQGEMMLEDAERCEND